MNEPDDDAKRPRRRAPRGGRTTVSKDGYMIRKTVFVDWEVSDALRKQCRRKHLSEAQLVRQILRDHFGIE